MIMPTITYAARHHPDTQASNHPSSTNQPSADSRAAMMPNTANPVTNILEGTPVSPNVSNNRWAPTILVDYCTPNFVADGGVQKILLSRLPNAPDIIMEGS